MENRDIVGNIIKYENLIEYLRNRNVSKKILSNPRLCEYLDLIIDRYNIISFDKEIKNLLDEKLQVKENHGIKMVSENDEIHINQNSNKKHNGVSIIKRYSKKDMYFCSKRYFDNGGVEIERTLESSNDERIKHMDLISAQKETIGFVRDLDRADLMIKTKRKGNSIVSSEYYARNNFLNFHDLIINDRILKRVGLTQRDIFFKIQDKKTYELVKETFMPQYDKMMNEYKSYNKRYYLTKAYEKGIEKICNKNRIMGGI